ncbi:MAG TPA: carbon-nitrogen hydrolase family protein [Pseudobdellovibrionaceae bacterium]|nr:carbon-nitrogen hydrolase family protein [Pseudobdellovibrionaceae bacterium]
MGFPDLTIALCQMTSVDDVEANLMQMEELIERIPESSGARAAFFPENSLYLRLKEGESIRGLMPQDQAFSVLSRLAIRRRMHLHLTAPFRIEGHLYNTSLWINDEGTVKPTYQKMHLFDISLADGPSVRESDVFRHGAGPSVIEIDGWRFGESICYDIRFSELYSIYARQEVDAVLIPSAFLTRTGEAHWDLLVRSRAIESQCYAIAPAQGGVHQGASSGVRETHGNSLIVDPWGRVLSRVVERGPGVEIQTLNREEIEKVRRQIPMKDHRRLPVDFGPSH